MDVTELRAETRAVLAALPTDAALDDAALDQALREGLAMLDELLPPAEETLPAGGGPTLSLDPLPDLRHLLAVAYPWTPGADFAQRCRPFRWVDRRAVAFAAAAPAAGEPVLVRYQRAHRLAGLDGAEAGTFPERAREALALAAAACALRGLFRRRARAVLAPGAALIAPPLSDAELERIGDMVTGLIEQAAAVVRPHSGWLEWGRCALGER